MAYFARPNGLHDLHLDHNEQRAVLLTVRGSELITLFDCICADRRAR